MKVLFWWAQSHIACQRPSHTHEGCINAIHDVFLTAISTHNIPWKVSTGEKFVIEDKDSPIGLSVEPDMSVHHKLQPIVIVKVATSETLAHVQEKIAQCMVMPSIMRAIIVNVNESPTFSNLNTPPTLNHQWMSQERWDALVFPDWGLRWGAWTYLGWHLHLYDGGP